MQKLCKYLHEICKINLHRWDYNNKINATPLKSSLRRRTSRTNKSIFDVILNTEWEVVNESTDVKILLNIVYRTIYVFWKNKIFFLEENFKVIFFSASSVLIFFRSLKKLSVWIHQVHIPCIRPWNLRTFSLSWRQ